MKLRLLGGAREKRIQLCCERCRMKKENNNTAAAAAAAATAPTNTCIHTINIHTHRVREQIRNIGKKAARNLNSEKKKKKRKNKTNQAKSIHTHIYKMIQTGLIFSVVYTDLKPLIHTAQRSAAIYGGFFASFRMYLD